MKDSGIQHFQVHLNANKGAVRIQSCDMNRAMNIILDRSNHPILVHCNKGKVSSFYCIGLAVATRGLLTNIQHRTGCLVATLRRLQGHDIELIREEYHKYADPKARFWDEVFFEHFDLNTVMWHARQENWIEPQQEDADGVMISPPPSPACSLGFTRA